MSLSMTQQHRIRIDLPNTAVKPKIDSKCMLSRSLHNVPRAHDAALTKPGNIIQILYGAIIMPGQHHIMLPGQHDASGQHCILCTSRDARRTNHDRVIQIVI